MQICRKIWRKENGEKIKEIYGLSLSGKFMFTQSTSSLQNRPPRNKSNVYKIKMKKSLNELEKSAKLVNKMVLPIKKKKTSH